MADRGFTLGRSISVIAPGAACVLTPVEEMEERGKRKDFSAWIQEGDTQLWKSAGPPGGVSAMEQMSQSQRLRVQSFQPLSLSLFLDRRQTMLGGWRSWSGVLVLACCVARKTTTVCVSDRLYFFAPCR